MTVAVPGHVVVGRVIDSNGEPVAGAAVTVHGTGQFGSHGFASNKAGKFRMDGVPRGPFLIVLRKDGYARTGLNEFASENGGEIDVGDVVILPGGSVAVHVESQSGAAVNGGVP